MTQSNFLRIGLVTALVADLAGLLGCVVRSPERNMVYSGFKKLLQNYDSLQTWDFHVSWRVGELGFVGALTNR